MSSEFKKELERVAVSVGGQTWAVLIEAVDDDEFLGLLTRNQAQLLKQSAANPNHIRSYFDEFATIVSKFYAWKTSKDTGLKELEKKVRQLTKEVDSGQRNLESINKLAALASGATVLVAHSQAFSDRADAHKQRAEYQFACYLISLLVLLLVVWLTFFFSIAEYRLIYDNLADDIKLPFSIGVYGLKAITLIFFFQISQFFKKSYGAEMHLEQVNRHRSDVLQSLHAVYVSIDSKDEKDRILAAGALFAYERGESGYITTKEGAGSADNLFEGILGRMFRL